MKILATDIDGTLINSKHKISHQNKKRIKEINALGKHVIVATGRSHLGAIQLFKSEGIQCAKICSNGAIIVDEQGNVIGTSPANRKSMERCVEILSKQKVYFEMATNHGAVLQNLSKEKDIDAFIEELVGAGHAESVESFWRSINERVEDGILKLVDSYNEIFSDEKTEIYKIFVASADYELLNQLKATFCADTELCITSSWTNNLEINGKGVSKGNAIKAYAEKIGYDVRDVVAIGDSYNDVSMFEAAGIAVAMGNAPKDVQVLCDWVTGTNDESGWADAAQKFMIDEEVAVVK